MNEEVDTFLGASFLIAVDQRIDDFVVAVDSPGYLAVLQLQLLQIWHQLLLILVFQQILESADMAGEVMPVLADGLRLSGKGAVVGAFRLEVQSDHFIFFFLLLKLHVADQQQNKDDRKSDGGKQDDHGVGPFSLLVVQQRIHSLYCNMVERVFVFLFCESESTRSILMGIVSVSFLLALSDRLMDRKHSRLPFILLQFVKFGMAYFIEWHALTKTGFDAAADAKFLVYSVWRDTLNVALFLWTYGGNGGKTGLTLFLEELGVTVLLFPLMYLINFVERRPSLTQWPASFHMADLLLPVLAFLIWKVIEKPFSKIAKKYRNWKPRRTWLMWTVTIVYSASSSLISTGSEFSVRGMNRLLMMHQLCGLTFMGLLMVWLMYQQHLETERQRFLVRQVKVLGTYDQIVAANRHNIERIRQQLKQDVSVNALWTNENADKVVDSYLAQLRQDASALQERNAYCSDLLINVILQAQEQSFIIDGIPR